MGAVASCLETIVNAIGAFFMAIINGIGAIRTNSPTFTQRHLLTDAVSALVRGIVAVFDAIISCICCGKGGGGRSRA